MKNWSIAIVFGVIASLIGSCKTDPFNCKSEEVGDVSLSQESRLFFPAINVSTVTFENAAGAQRTYTVRKQDLRVALHVEKLCEGTNLTTHYYYMSGDVSQYVLSSGTDSFQIQLAMATAQVKSKKDTAFYEQLAVVHLEKNSGAELTRITSERGNASKIPQSDKDAQVFTYVQDTILNGRPYQDVYYGQKIQGSAADSKTNLFIAKGRGIIGYADDAGVVWLKN
jgi:hypothetical protein